MRRDIRARVIRIDDVCDHLAGKVGFLDQSLDAVIADEGIFRIVVFVHDQSVKGARDLKESGSATCVLIQKDVVPIDLEVSCGRRGRESHRRHARRGEKDRKDENGKQSFHASIIH